MNCDWLNLLITVILTNNVHVRIPFVWKGFRSLTDHEKMNSVHERRSHVHVHFGIGFKDIQGALMSFKEL